MSRAAAVLVFLCSTWAAADPLATREGETGTLDVPSADSIVFASAALSGELRLDLWHGTLGPVGPSPVSLVTGLGHGVELGVFGHQGDLPGDETSSPFLLGVALKVHLLDSGTWPALAADAQVDRLNDGPLVTIRGIASTPQWGRAQLNGFVGVAVDTVSPASAAFTAGIAESTNVRDNLRIIVEGIGGGEGPLVGVGLAWLFTQDLSFTAGANWLPSEHGFRFSIGVQYVSPSPFKRTKTAAPEPPPPIAPAPEKTTAPGRLEDETPHLRQLIKPSQVPGEDSGRHLQYGPEVPPPEAPASPPESQTPLPRESTGAIVPTPAKAHESAAAPTSGGEAGSSP